MTREKRGGVPESEDDESSKEVQEFKGFKVGKEVAWKDEESRIKFNHPAFGYGDGPFILEKIFLPFGPDAAQRDKNMNNLLLQITTAKETKKRISADYFKAN